MSEDLPDIIYIDPETGEWNDRKHKFRETAPYLALDMVLDIVREEGKDWKLWSHPAGRAFFTLADKIKNRIYPGNLVPLELDVPIE